MPDDPRRSGGPDLPVAGAARARQAIVGAWRLREWTASGSDGTTSEPFGPQPSGLLVYGADGTMITVITPSSDLDVDGSAGRCFAYAGRYELAAGGIVHIVEISCRPDWVGTRQVRTLDLDESGTSLILMSGPLDIDGAGRIHRLVWERCGPSTVEAKENGSP